MVVSGRRGALGAVFSTTLYVEKIRPARTHFSLAIVPAPVIDQIS
jgi:hypothetical protein